MLHRKVGGWETGLPSFEEIFMSYEEYYDDTTIVVEEIDKGGVFLLQ